MCKYKNIWNIQRVVRVVVWILVLAFWYFYQSNWGYIGLIPLITWLIGNCPACYLGNLPVCMKKKWEKDTCWDWCNNEHE